MGRTQTNAQPCGACRTKTSGGRANITPINIQDISQLRLMVIKSHFHVIVSLHHFGNNSAD
jgi:hypothetical protein